VYEIEHVATHGRLIQQPSTIQNERAQKRLSRVVCWIGVEKVFGQFQVCSIAQIGYRALCIQTVLNRLIVKCVHEGVQFLFQLLVNGFHIAFAI
jgi:hypothetical protein